MEFAFIFGNQYNESGAAQQMPGKKGEQPLAPTKAFNATWGYSLVLSPAPAGRRIIDHGNAVGMGTRSANHPLCLRRYPTHCHFEGDSLERMREAATEKSWFSGQDFSLRSK